MVNQINMPAFGYTQYNFTALATAATTTLSFAFRHDPAYFYLDDVSVTAATAAVPEPSSWAFMILGFGLVGGAMRYRKGKQTLRFA